MVNRLIINSIEILLLIVFFSIGFDCPIQNSIQYLCCGTDEFHYCCSPDLDEIERIHSINNANVPFHSNLFLSINRSASFNEDFQRIKQLSLPIFLLASSVLLLLGIVIWLCLYKQNGCFASDRHLNVRQQPNRSERSKYSNVTINPMENRKPTINLTMTMGQTSRSRAILQSSTEV